ncbi:DUF7504 family protein [Haloarcula marina]|uniref:DUF7504 family protein n=1 Tax=Haloarcula marina TaxID=2961574 RepID=UPI0020B8A2FC|nr:DICT sensory domain-containing protein [Halomicroarcula marina]
MYNVGDSLPVDGVAPGSTLLVVGPPMTGKRELVTRLLAKGFSDGDGVAVVTTDSSAADVRESIAQYAEMPPEGLPLGIVDCLGDAHDRTERHSLDSRVGSPADLTGIGMELTSLLEALYEGHSRTLRVGLLSLTTMSMYAPPEQVVRFLHVVSNRIAEANGVGFVVAHSDTMDEEHLQRLRSFVDGVVEIRERETDVQLRVVGVDSEPTAWVPYDRDGRPKREPGESPSAAALDAPVDDSLRSLLESVRAESPTLTVCNYDGPPETLSVLERYFDRHGIAVREATMDVPQPRGVALLHHGDDVLASESISSLSAAIELQDGPDAFADRQTSDLLTHLDRSVFGAAAADRALLVDVSHSVEQLAYRTGGGRLHAGFQRLSNLTESPESARIYEKLAESGVEVHLYGVPDTEVTVPGVTVHPADPDSEIAESWFVVYDGGGDPDNRGTLLAVQRGDDTFEGFWSYDGDIERRAEAYLAATYGESAQVRN